MARSTTAREYAERILGHILERLDLTPAEREPFSHIYLEHVLPWDVYVALLNHLPEPGRYGGSSERHRGYGDGGFVRKRFDLTRANVASLPAGSQELFAGLAAAMVSPELKQAMYAKLAPDLAFRYGIPEGRVGELNGFSRPILYRETEGFEIAPHPDTRKKIVTMHLYWPADESQLELGTALYRRRQFTLPFGDWHRRFEKVKQFAFRPNSGYAFVVNNALTKKSWHGRERLPAGAGVRNTLLNTFYESPREGYDGYLDEDRWELPPARAA
jgi:hypothetical protein